MATLALDSVLIYYDDIDFGQYSNSLQVVANVDEHDATTFASGGWRTFVGGLNGGDFTIGGFWGFTDPDDITFDAINSSPTAPLLTATPEGAEGDVAYLFKPHALSRSTGGNDGDLAGLTLAGKFNGRLYRGGLTMARQTITGDTNGSGIQFVGGIPTTSYVGVGVHVFTDNGTSLDVIVERDDNAGFTTATTVTTIAITGTGPLWYEAAGPGGSDDYWRVRTANLVGTNFEIAASIGIAS